jgi:hypothetical protein
MMLTLEESGSVQGALATESVARQHAQSFTAMCWGTWPCTKGKIESMSFSMLWRS